MSKFNLVTGDPRSGTSLMMYVLRTLGCPIHGFQYMTDQISLDKAQSDSWKKANPNGLWEDIRFVGKGISEQDELDEVAGKFVKVVSSGARILRQGTKVGINYANVDKIIICTRNPAEIMVSQKSLPSGISIGSKNGEKDFGNQLPGDFYLTGTGRLTADYLWNPPIFNRALIVDFADWQMPKDTVDKIIAYTGITVSSIARNAAIDIIDPALFRSKPKATAPEEFQQIYTALKNRDYSKKEAVSQIMQSFQKKKSLETALWLDETFGTMSQTSPEHYRLLRDKEKTRVALKVIADQKRAKGKLSDICSHFQRSDETQAIVLPADLTEFAEGDKNVLRIKKVNCGRDNKTVTLMQCQQCWITDEMAKQTPSVSHGPSGPLSYFVSFDGGWYDNCIYHGKGNDSNTVILDVDGKEAIGKSSSGYTISSLCYNESDNRWELSIGGPDDLGEFQPIWQGFIKGKRAYGTYATLFANPCSTIHNVVVS